MFVIIYFSAGDGWYADLGAMRFPQKDWQPLINGVSLRVL